MRDELIDHRFKGIPGSCEPFALESIGAKRWNILREDMTLPVAVLKDTVVTSNGDWMRRFLGLTGAKIAPHGKTTMSPELFRRQLRDGAWAITIGTITQLQTARDFGFARLLLANQLVGPQAIRYVLGELARDPAFDFYCLVDSVENVEALAREAKRAAAARPLQVLLEGGLLGARTGCRTVAKALEVARAVKRGEPYLSLRGVEGFEGVAAGGTRDEKSKNVSDFLDLLVEIALSVEKENLFGDGMVILSAGGSAFYDLVARRFAAAKFPRPFMVLTRSGCYLTHDSKSYKEEFAALLKRSPEAGGLGVGLRPALEVWAYVQSTPEPTRVILNMGQRDCGRDAGLPVPFQWFRPGHHNAPQALGPAYDLVAMNDQHSWMDAPAGHPLRVGDMVASGVSHPCTTLDKWRMIPVVNDVYDVISGVRTWF
jgi:D-serine dehydratase